MSSLVFPELPGLSIERSVTVRHRTLVQGTESGQELRIRRLSGPHRRYTVRFNGLRQRGVPDDEAQTLISFFNAHGGAWDSFLITDPIDGVQRRVRFEDDDLEFEQLAKGLWRVSDFSLITTSVDYGTYPEPPPIDPNTGSSIVINGADGSVWLMSVGNDRALVTSEVITEGGGSGVDLVLQSAGGTKYRVQVDAVGRLDPQVYVGAITSRTLSLKSPNQKTWNVTVGNDGALDPVEIA